MSRWESLAICAKCWVAENPDRKPVVITQTGIEKCCRCGDWTSAGIYIRAEVK